MFVIEWYKRCSSATKRRLESVWETGLVVFVAYLSPYIASPEGVSFDRAFLIVVVALSLILYIKVKRDSKIRHSGNRIFTLANRSIAWSFGVFLGALSPAFPVLLGLTFQYPYAVVVILGGFLLFAFEQIFVNKENDELIKPESVPETVVAKKELRNWRTVAKKRVMRFVRKHPRLSVSILATFAGLVVIYFSMSIDRQTVSTAAQSMIQLAAFLAGASGVMTAIYLGQVLRGITKNATKSIPSWNDVIRQATTQAASEAKDQESQARLTVELLNKGMKFWQDSISGEMGGARLIRIAGSYPISFLVASAISAVLVILTGSALLFGLSVGLMILATWAIFRGWQIGEQTMRGVIGTESILKDVDPAQFKISYPSDNQWLERTPDE